MRTEPICEMFCGPMCSLKCSILAVLGVALLLAVASFVRRLFWAIVKG